MTLIRSLLPCVLLSPAVVFAAPGDVVVVKPTAICPESQIGDDQCQASYDDIWKKYGSRIAEHTATVEKTLTHLYDEAKSAGNLDLVLFWDDLRKSFASTGKVVWEPSTQKKAWKKFGDAEFPTGLSNDLRKCMDGYEDAKTALEDGYKKLVVELTKAGKVDEALAMRKEAAALWAMLPPPAPKPSPPKQEANGPNAIRLQLRVAVDGKTEVSVVDGPQPQARRERSDLGNGVWRLRHLFEQPDDAVLLSGSPLRQTEYVTVNPARRILEVRPGVTKGYGSPIGSHIWYPIAFSLPVTLEVDFRFQHEGFEFAVFPHHSQEKAGQSTFISLAPDSTKQGAFRFYARQMNGASSTDCFNEVVTLGDRCTRTFSLPITNADQDVPYVFFQISVGPNNPTARELRSEPLVAEIHELAITGRPVPVYGMRLGEQSGAVVVDGVVPGSSAEKAGVQQGDVVSAVNKTPISSREEAMALLRKTMCGEAWKLDVLRNQVPQAITMKWELPE